eukprot:TRINITY_DN267_c1_g1_i1.p1 TRINITY_DN267_c1_g1~~TRINITY_DN267_c1_g1_i1.p1  ORF type:complete len:591 (+),score=254.59 TRINITY_DN267_c1_g1_i1:233-1774(+)
MDLPYLFRANEGAMKQALLNPAEIAMCLNDKKKLMKLGMQLLQGGGLGALLGGGKKPAGGGGGGASPGTRLRQQLAKVADENVKILDLEAQLNVVEEAAAEADEELAVVRAQLTAVEAREAVQGELHAAELSGVQGIVARLQIEADAAEKRLAEAALREEALQDELELFKTLLEDARRSGEDRSSGPPPQGPLPPLTPLPAGHNTAAMYGGSPAARTSASFSPSLASLSDPGEEPPVVPAAELERVQAEHARELAELRSFIASKNHEISDLNYLLLEMEARGAAAAVIGSGAKSKAAAAAVEKKDLVEKNRRLSRELEQQYVDGEGLRSDNIVLRQAVDALQAQVREVVRQAAQGAVGYEQQWLAAVEQLEAARAEYMEVMSQSTLYYARMRYYRSRTEQLERSARRGSSVLGKASKLVAWASGGKPTAEPSAHSPEPPPAAKPTPARQPETRRRPGSSRLTNTPARQMLRQSRDVPSPIIPPPLSPPAAPGIEPPTPPPASGRRGSKSALKK